MPLPFPLFLSFIYSFSFLIGVILWGGGGRGGGDFFRIFLSLFGVCLFDSVAVLRCHDDDSMALVRISLRNVLIRMLLGALIPIFQVVQSF